MWLRPVTRFAFHIVDEFHSAGKAGEKLIDSFLRHPSSRIGPGAQLGARCRGMEEPSRPVNDSREIERFSGMFALFGGAFLQLTGSLGGPAVPPSLRPLDVQFVELFGAEVAQEEG